MKKCPNCQKEFNPTTYRGTEQIYCSKKCRSQQGNIRYKQKLIEYGVHRTSNGIVPNNFGTTSDGNTEKREFTSNNNSEREAGIHFQSTSIINSEVLRYVEQAYEAKANALKFELKYEAALQELNLCKSQLAAAEMELEMEPEEKKGIAGFLEDIPEWITPALAKILQSEKVQNFVINAIPDQQNTNQ